MSNPVVVSADELHLALAQAASWEKAVARGSNGETVAITAGGEHVADVVPAGALEALLETIAVLSDPEALEALRDTEVVVTGTEAIRHLVATRER